MGGVQAKLTETEREVEKARKESTSARERFNDIKKQRSDLFNKAYTHISDRIDQVYKDLTKGNASPMGGVAYLSLEDSEVSHTKDTPGTNQPQRTDRALICVTGALPCWYQVPRDAADEAIPRHGPALGRRADRRCAGPLVRDPQVRTLFLGSF